MSSFGMEIETIDPPSNVQQHTRRSDVLSCDESCNSQRCAIALQVTTPPRRHSRLIGSPGHEVTRSPAGGGPRYAGGSSSDRYAASSGSLSCLHPSQSSHSPGSFHETHEAAPSTHSSSAASSAASSVQTQSPRAQIYSDRHIPSRAASRLDEAFQLHYPLADGPSLYTSDCGQHLGSSGIGSTALPRPQPSSDVARENQGIMNSLLRAELLGHSLIYSPKAFEPVEREGGAGIGAHQGGVFTSAANVFRYSAGGSEASSLSGTTGRGSSGSGRSSSSLDSSSFGPSLASPGISPSRLLLSPKKRIRRIPRAPYKVLDAPSLQDDYYLNLVDWSSSNLLSVALGSSVYLWSAATSKVTKLCEVGSEGSDSVSSISWAVRGTHLAVGTNLGKVQIWDVQRGEKVREMAHHSSRVGTMAWSSSLLATGSRDRSIFLQDLRVRSNTGAAGGGGGGGGAGSGSSGTAGAGESDRGAWAVSPASGDPCVVRELQAHKQEVCGLKWSPDERMLASGGNDNKLFVWSLAHGDAQTPLCRFSDHCAAVKAVAWSPHQHGLLASGGGTADRNIRFWNALSGVALHRIDTGSQVCNLMWSKNVNEMVSTHGYSLNQIIVWKYPSMQKVATLQGHSLRVLYLAMSPDGQSIVTGAGDETLRFWNIFPGVRNARTKGIGLLVPGNEIR